MYVDEDGNYVLSYLCLNHDGATWRDVIRVELVVDELQLGVCDHGSGCPVHAQAEERPPGVELGDVEGVALEGPSQPLSTKQVKRHARKT